ncbi:hypothetical protein ACIGBL_04580 [Streptomyces sp. NPDC085614]|uniref:hypothetical protein n=1 Tax=Streptomyces sp. NPDC085614 TaxID=3365733 RepID=UPI0037D01F22
MDLTPYVDRLRHELAVAANIAGDEARAVTERLTAPLESAARLILLNAFSAAADELSQALAPTAVSVRLRGLDPEFTVTAQLATAHSAPTSAEAAAVMAPSMAPVAPCSPDGEEGGTARINFRLPAPLKAQVERTAGREGLSANAWLVRAVALALGPDAAPAPRARTV